jgi:hypothetical protein
MFLHHSSLIRLTGRATSIVLAFVAGAFWTPLPVNAQEDEPIPIQICVDIRPGLCPNHLRIESPLTIPIAIIGTVGFEMGQIDPSTIRLTRQATDAAIEPLSWEYADVGTPLIGGRCACHELRGDGIDDLEFRFLIGDVVTAFGLEGHTGELFELNLTGNLMTGEAIEGTDCAVVISGLCEDEYLGDEVGMLMCRAEPPDAKEFKFTYFTTVSDRVTLAVYDVRGRVVATLLDMDLAPGIYTAIWNGMSHDEKRVPAGDYFARVNNSLASETRKITVFE